MKILHKILIGLILLILIPVGLFTIYEYSRINEDEKLIKTVYQKQLETIVSSLNSNVQDVVESWASRIDLWMDNRTDSTYLIRMTSKNPAITGIYLQNNSHIETIYEVNKPTNIKLLPNNESSVEINRLFTYYKNHYRKFVSQQQDSATQAIYFVCSDELNKPVLCITTINLKQFLESYVKPRIQSIAQENFVIELKNELSNQVIISTEKGKNLKFSFDQEGELWIIPQIKIGISLKNKTISDLASNRTKESIIMAATLFIVLLIGICLLYRSFKKEIHLAQIKSEFISNVSHEIRTPLALISMYIETLEMGRIINAEKVQEYYSIIRKETERLTGMVNKILSFSRIEKGKQQYKLKKCDLTGIAENVLDTYRFHFRSKGFTFEFHPTDQSQFISCDSESISNALINIIDNAVKYSKEIKKIIVSTGIEKNMAYIEVKDFGPGISKKNQKMVFDKFFRVTEGNLANEVKGTGLGLAIVSEVVKAHKGKITLNSKLGEGCSFRLYFPIVNE